MPQISYVNGSYLPHSQAAVHIEDRGYQFADGVYEVIAVKNGIMIDGEPHLERLERSLRELSIAEPMSRAALKIIIKELLRKNRSKDDSLYIQISRGVAKRNHPFPKDAAPSVVMTLLGAKPPSPTARENGIHVITHRDLRWARKDIKSIALLPNILAKQAAVEAKVQETWLVNDEGFVTEGSSTNSYIITDKGVIVTHPANENILGGITRQTVLRLARAHGLKVEERPYTVEEAKNAAEAFLTSTTQGVIPVVQIDSTVISNGHPREVTCKLMKLYDDYVEEVTA